MKVVALVSGGKDSCYNMMMCQKYGHEVVALANLLPMDDNVEELDSFMYQTVGHSLVGAYASCMGLPLFRRRIRGQSKLKDLRYQPTQGDEVEDLEVLLRAVKAHFPDISAVSSGAIASDYQRLRVENVCSRLGLVSLAYLWRQDQKILFQEMITSGIEATLVKVAAAGLEPKTHLGKTLAEMQSTLLKLAKVYGGNVCGEGGEYESLTLDCPLFKFACIVLDEFAIDLHSPDTYAPVGVLRPLRFHLKQKSNLGQPSPEPTIIEINETPSQATLHDHLEDENIHTFDFDGLEALVREQETGFAVISCRVKGGPTSVNTTEALVNGRQKSTQESRTSPTDGETFAQVGHTSVNPGQTLVNAGQTLVNRLEAPENSAQTSVNDGQTLVNVGQNGIDATSTYHDLKRILVLISQKLEEVQCSWKDAIYVHLYLKKMEHFGEANRAYKEVITEGGCAEGGGVPSRSTVEVPLMEGGGMADVLLWRPSKGCDMHPKKVLHVQSISEWAPSCIGPYSQATAHWGVLSMAGMLGLHPPTMELVPGGASSQMAAALKSCEAVAQAMGTSVRNNAFVFTVYVTHEIPKNQARIELDKFLKNDDDEENVVEDKIWKPLVQFVRVSGLPKSAEIEVAPLPFISNPASFELEHLHLEDSLADAHSSVKTLEIVKMSSWEFGLTTGSLNNGQFVWEHCPNISVENSPENGKVMENSPENGKIMKSKPGKQIVMKGLCVKERFARLHGYVINVEKNIKDEVDELWRICEEALEGANLSGKHATGVRCYIDTTKFPFDEGRAAISEIFTRAQMLAIVVPVLGVGSLDLENAVLAMEVTALGDKPPH